MTVTTQFSVATTQHVSRVRTPQQEDYSALLSPLMMMIMMMRQWLWLEMLFWWWFWSGGVRDGDAVYSLFVLVMVPSSVAGSPGRVSCGMLKPKPVPSRNC